MASRVLFVNASTLLIMDVCDMFTNTRNRILVEFVVYVFVEALYETTRSLFCRTCPATSAGGDGGLGERGGRCDRRKDATSDQRSE